MSDQRGDGGRPEADAVDAALAVVPGIVSSSLSTDHDGAPIAVRIVLEPDVDEVEVATAAHRILRLQFGVGLDPAHIQVVEESWPEPSLPQQRLRLVEDADQHLLELRGPLAPLLAGIDEDDARYGTDVLEAAVRHPAGAAAPLPGAKVTSGRQDQQVVDVSVTALPDRLAIAHLALAADRAAVSAVVTLLRGRTEHVGMAGGGAAPDQVRGTIAQAAANAISDALGPGIRLEVEGVSVPPAGELEVVVVQVAWVTADGRDRLLGATEVRDDVRQAVIRATLDAVNRRLALALDRR